MVFSKTQSFPFFFVMIIFMFGDFHFHQSVVPLLLGLYDVNYMKVWKFDDKRNHKQTEGLI